jgi:hypothetical protein
VLVTVDGGDCSCSHPGSALCANVPNGVQGCAYLFHVCQHILDKEPPLLLLSSC